MRFSPTRLHRKATCLLITAALILTPIYNFRSHLVQAFMPGQLSATLIAAPGNWSHDDITEAAIVPLYNEFFGIRRLNIFQDAALEHIQKENANTDLGDEYYKSAPHADGENIYGAQERLTSYKSQVFSLMQGAPGNRAVESARYFVGRALHTLQDFYSHSNWIENHASGSVDLFDPLGELNTIIAGPSRDLRTCTDCSRNVCSQCENNIVTLEVTTGYFGSDDNGSGGRKPPWKCSHGGPKDSSAPGLIGAGINKDTNHCIISPHNVYHRRAASFAREHTKKYLREIKNLIGLSKMSVLLGGNPRLAFVVDTTGSMGFEIASVRQQILSIIDARISLGLPTTYSLIPFNDPSIGTITTTDDPDVFRNAVLALGSSGGEDCPEPVNRALIRAFDEMGTGGDILLFTDALAKDSSFSLSVGAFARASGIRLTSVFSGGSTDCGLFDPGLSTLSFDTGGQYFTLDPSEVGLISHLANFLALPFETDLFSTIGFVSTTQQVYTVPVDSSLTRMVLSVTGTGATNIVVRRPDNTIVQPTDPNVSRIAVSSGVLYSIVSPAVGTWSITIAGDSELGMNEASRYMESLTTAGNFNILESGPSNQFEPLETTATMPAVQQAQQFSIRVAGESTIDVTSFDFVELAGRPGHEGYRPIEGSPTAGKLTTVEAKLATEGASTAVIQLRGLDGTVLQTLSLQELAWPGDFEDVPEPRENPTKQYYGDVTVPSQPFQVYVTGQDGNGNAYQRLLPGIIRPQTVEIIAPPIANLHPGQSFSYYLQVKNNGPADNFQLAAVDDQNFITSVIPTGFPLGTNETKNVLVQVQVPANAVPLTLDTLRFSVQGNSARNTATVGPVTVERIPALTLGNFTLTPIGGNGDNVLDRGEGGSLSFQLINNGSNTASNIRANLFTSTPNVLISQAASDYADLAPSANGTNLTPFVFYLSPNLECGQTIQFTLSVSSEGNGNRSEGDYNVAIQVGQSSSSNGTRSYTGPAVPIPDNDPGGVNIPITVSGMTGTLDDLNFRIDGTSCDSATTVGLDHTWVGDLIVKLQSPSGTVVNLINQAGGSGDNFCNTILDDQAVTSIQSLGNFNSPFTGTFKPNQPLSTFKGQNPNGVWTLNVSDNEGSDVGNVRAFSLVLSTVQYTCNSPAPADTTAPSCTPTDFRAGPPPSADLTIQDTGIGLASVNVIAADNVNVTVPAFTLGTTAPVIVTGTLINPAAPGSFQIQSVDVAGNSSTCERVLAGAVPPKILFRTNRNGTTNYELYVMNDDGSNPTRITNANPPTSGNYQPAWAPNGQKVGFAAEQDGATWWDIIVMNLDGTNRVNLTQHNAFESYFAWSPDSSKIVFESHRDGPYALWLINADGTGLTRLLNNGGPEQPPAWSPNGQKIAFLSYINSVNNKTDVWLMNANGSSPTNLTQSSDQESMIRWSPDGTKILFARRPSSSSPYDLYVINADGTGLQRLTTNSSSTDAQWSPDGTKIVFQSNRTGNLEIFVMNANGSNQTNLTNNSGSDFSPKWSKDGSRILFGSLRTGNYEIFIMNANGTGQVNLTNNAAVDDSASWQP